MSSKKSSVIKYKSPKPEEKEFTRMWNIFIVEISQRENFKEAHLYQLEMLCDLHLEYRQLSDFVSLMGSTYESGGRNGEQVKIRPEVIQINRVRADIATYTKMLGLLLYKDKALGADAGQQREWE